MKRRLIILGVALALAGAAVIYLPKAIGFLRVGTAFAAQQTCACLHVSGRPLESCLADLGSSGRLLDVKADGQKVRAGALFGLFSAASVSEPPYGCRPEP